jgi:hypothetical protein
MNPGWVKHIYCGMKLVVLVDDPNCAPIKAGDIVTIGLIEDDIFWTGCPGADAGQAWVFECRSAAEHFQPAQYDHRWCKKIPEDQRAAWIASVKSGDKLRVLVDEPQHASYQRGETVEVVKADSGGLSIKNERGMFGVSTSLLEYLYEPVDPPKPDVPTPAAKRFEKPLPGLEWLNTIKPGDKLVIVEPFSRNTKPGTIAVYMSDDNDQAGDGKNCYLYCNDLDGKRRQSLDGCAWRYKPCVEPPPEPKLTLRDAIRRNLLQGTES